MTGTTPLDQAAADDAQLRALGIQPELKRTLGFLANFALAFSFISVSTGSFGNFGVGIGLGGPAFFWSWPIVLGGQFLVALVFAELASHFPVAGSIYQWSKRLSNRTLGWFTGWIYFWAQVVTVTAVAVIVAFVVDGLHSAAFPAVDGAVAFLDSPDPFGFTTMFTMIAVSTLIITTIINAFGIRLLALLNNIGVATEIIGMFVFALILLFFANHQPLSVLTDTGGAETATNGNYFAAFALGSFMALFVIYGFDTAGTFAEETVDASRQAPRGILTALLLSGLIGAIFLIAVILAIPSIPDAMAEGQAGGFPIATTISTVLSGELIFGITLGEIYLAVILASVFVCTMAIQGAASRLMFSMGRDHHLPGGRLWGTVNHRFQSPANAVVAVGVLAVLPILVIGPLGGLVMAIAATGLIYLSYWLCNLGVLTARLKGWPHQKAWFNLGALGMPINIVALLYGGLMIINIGLWADPGLFGDFCGDGRLYTNPFIGAFFKPLGQELTWLPAWPTFETIIGVIMFFGVIYYLAAVRGTAHDVESADTATGEAVIG